MQKHIRDISGNFLVQALLALALIMAFMPMISYKIAGQKLATQMSAAAEQVAVVTTAARIYMREEYDKISYGKTVLKGDAFADALEPMGLPLGFVSRTPFGQNITFVVSKGDKDSMALVVISGGDLTRTRRAELGARIGFWAAYLDDSGSELIAFGGGWRANISSFGITPDKDAIFVRIPMEEEFSELVRRSEKNPELNGFLTDLNMGDFSVRNIGSIFAMDGNFGAIMSDSFVLFGLEDGRKIKNNIETITTRNATFKSVDGGNALSITKGALGTNNVYARTVSAYGDSGNLKAERVSVYDFRSSVGSSNFVGPSKWNVKESAVMENITLAVESLEISSYLNAAKGTSVYIDSDGYTYSVKTGIDATNVTASHITLRDQISSGLTLGSSGAVILDIRPGGVSVLPDAYVASLNNDALKIISRYDDEDGKLTECKAVISRLQSKASVADRSEYNAKSLTHNLVCQYVLWQRLERRIDLKQCLLDGKSDCN